MNKKKEKDKLGKMHVEKVEYKTKEERTRIEIVWNEMK